MIEMMAIQEVTMGIDDFERMKNCVNCDHKEVCLLVAQRKARKANDYSPCSNWKLVDEDEAE